MIAKKFRIPNCFSRQRLDKALTRLMPGHARMHIQQWIKKSLVQVNQHVMTAPDFKIQVDDEITIRIPAKSNIPQDYHAEKLPLDVIFEDTDLLVVNKPAGLVVHPGAGHAQHTLVNGLLHYDRNLHHVPRAGLIHRLDKDTSGLLIVTKNMYTYLLLTEALKKHEINREYRAIAKGVIPFSGQINAPVGRHRHMRTQMAVHPAGKAAVTRYRVLQQFTAYTYLSIQLETGRTHQIRVHMMHIHHPLLGDPVYGKGMHPKGQLSEPLRHTVNQFKRQALHAYRLKFMHPVKQNLVELKSPLPVDFRTLLQALEKNK
jgi:23S rRNA pseudouridine1911/1915/1917 synthase